MAAMKEYRSRKSDEDGKRESFPNVMASLRQLTIASASLILGRFDRTLRQMGFNTLVDDLNHFRAKNLGTREILALAKREGDAETNTGLEKLRFLTYGSPKLRFILHHIHTYVVPQVAQDQSPKLLITEDVPLNAFFFESVLNMIYIETEVMHAALSEAERINLVKRFNDSNDSLLVLIITYQVSAQGVNLDSCCCRALVTTPAINAPSEIQAWSRLIRVRHRFLFHTRDNVDIAEPSLERADRKRKKPERFGDDIQLESSEKKKTKLANSYQSEEGEKDLTEEDSLEDSEENFIENSKKDFIENSEKDLTDDDENHLTDDDEKEMTDQDDDSYHENESEAPAASFMNELLSETITTKKLRAQYMKLTLAEQERYDQEEMNLRYLLSLSPIKTYVIEDLQDVHVLDRALRLLFHRRYGEEKQFMKISPHINYDKLPGQVSTAITKKLKMKEEDMKKCYAEVKTISK